MHLNKHLTRLILVILVFTSLGLAGCGSKGPLYIPEQRYPQDAK